MSAKHVWYCRTCMANVYVPAGTALVCPACQTPDVQIDPTTILTDFDRFQAQASEIAARAWPDDRPDKNLANALIALGAEEFGELARAVRKLYGPRLGHSGEMPGRVDDVIDELGDVLFILARVATLAGVDLSLAAEAAVRKVGARAERAAEQKTPRSVLYVPRTFAATYWRYRQHAGDDPTRAAEERHELLSVIFLDVTLPDIWNCECVELPRKEAMEWHWYWDNLGSKDAATKGQAIEIAFHQALKAALQTEEVQSSGDAD